MSAKEVTLNYLKSMARDREEWLKQELTLMEWHSLQGELETLQFTIVLVEESEGE